MSEANHVKIGSETSGQRLNDYKKKEQCRNRARNI